MKWTKRILPTITEITFHAGFSVLKIIELGGTWDGLTLTMGKNLTEGRVSDAIDCGLAK